MIVVDASAIGAMVLPDEAGTFADLARQALSENAAAAPSVWPIELANIIVKAVRRGRLSPGQAEQTAARIADIVAAVTVVADAPVPETVALALAGNLSAYDASYALLARKLGAPLLTGDGPLRRSAATIGVQLFTL